MKMKRHTEGEWQFIHEINWSWTAKDFVTAKDGNRFVYLKGGDNRIIKYAGCGSHLMLIENPADVSLIEAAPKMLEALDDACNTIATRRGRMCHEGKAGAPCENKYCTVRNAISKAKLGEQPEEESEAEEVRTVTLPTEKGAK